MTARVPRIGMTSFPFDQPSTRQPAPAERPPVRWWLVGPLGALLAAVLVRWVADGGLRQLAPDRRGERDPHAALASLKQALLLTVTDVARALALVLVGALILATALTLIRLVGRRRWHYRRYAIAPYRTDEASTEQVVALFQDWHQQLHQRLHRRLVFGQPYLALEEHVRPDAGGAEATLAIVCPEQFVAALDGRLAATYPHSRIGHAFSRRFEPLELDIAWRHAIVRLRKHRAFTATVNTDTRQLDEPVIESELAAMAACEQPITVQKVLTPIFPGFERVARWMYARRERPPDPGEEGPPAVLPGLRARRARDVRPPRAPRRRPRPAPPARRGLPARAGRAARRARGPAAAAVLVRAARRIAQPRRLPDGGRGDRRPPPRERAAPAQHDLHARPAPPPRRPRAT